MITAKTLRKALIDILGIPEDHLVPISNNWFIPTVNSDDKVGDWVGYRILEKEPYTRGYQDGVWFIKPTRVRFRISFVGPQAEALADTTSLWEDRTDVKRIFNEDMEAEINYNSRINFSYPVRNGGFNDELCWVVDFTAQTFYKIDTKQTPWIPRG